MTNAFVAGVNLPLVRGAYNHDLSPNERYPEWGCELSPLWAFRYLAVCKELGFDAVRLWLCEDGEGIRTDGAGRVVGVMPQLLDAIQIFQEGASLLALKLYWTLLDGNSWHRNGDPIMGGIASDIGEARRFAEVVAAPIAAELSPDLTFALEVLNEPESLSAEVLGAEGLAWETIVDSIRSIREVLHQELSGVPITAGTQAIFLPGLLADRDADCPVDAIDLHVYHPDGGLPARGDLPVDIGDLPLLAGECGLSDRGEPGRNDYLLHYLYNAPKLGYEAAFIWKLEGDELLVRREQVPNAPEDTEVFTVNPIGRNHQALLRSRPWDTTTVRSSNTS